MPLSIARPTAAPAPWPISAPSVSESPFESSPPSTVPAILLIFVFHPGVQEPRWAPASAGYAWTHRTTGMSGGAPARTNGSDQRLSPLAVGRLEKLLAASGLS